MKQRAKYEPGVIVSCYKLVSWSHKVSGTNMWNMECLNCGALHIHSPAQIKQEPRKGCSKCTTGTTTHGRPKTDPTYISWLRMWQRVRGTDPTAKTYKHVTCCDRWLSFVNFVEDMGDRPAGTTLDRIDVFKGYEKSNCRWANRKLQSRNKTNTVYITINGVVKPLADWAEEYEVNYQTVYDRYCKSNITDLDMVFYKGSLKDYYTKSKEQQ